MWPPSRVSPCVVSFILHCMCTWILKYCRRGRGQNPNISKFSSVKSHCQHRHFFRHPKFTSNNRYLKHTPHAIVNPILANPHNRYIKIHSDHQVPRRYTTKICTTPLPAYTCWKRKSDELSHANTWKNSFTQWWRTSPNIDGSIGNNWVMLDIHPLY